MQTGRSVRNRARAFVFVIVAVLLIGSFTLQAQQVTGRLLGSVVDSSGAAVPNAAITITNQDTGVVRNTVSTSDGLYNDPQVPPGKYTVEAQAQGFSPAQVKGVVVTVGSDTRIDLKLVVGSVNQTVTVTEAVPQVNTTSSAIGGTVDEQKVADLPLNGRNWSDLTLMQAGVSQLHTATTFGGSGVGSYYSSNGSDLRSNMYLLDGAIMQNFFAQNNSSIIGTSLGVDGIKEYKVITNMFSAEYGLLTGSQTTIVSKSGTNAWHGDVYDYLRNSALDASEFFDVRNPANRSQSAVYPGKRNPPFRRNNFGASFGGPIKKDKTFFYAVYEGLRQQWGQTIADNSIPKACFFSPGAGGGPDVLNAQVPAVIDNGPNNPLYSASLPGACAKVVTTGPAGAQVPNGPWTVNAAALTLASVFPVPNITGESFNYSFPFIQPSSENYGQMRLDQNFSAKDSAFFRYTHDDADQTSPTTYAGNVNLLHSSSQFITASENHILTPTLLNTFRTSFSRTQVEFYFAPSPAGGGAPRLDLYFPFPNSITPGSGITGLSMSNPAPPPGNIQNIVTGSDDIFWSKGKHAFKFGVLYNHFQSNANTDLFAGGIATFTSLPAFLNGNYSAMTFITANSNQSASFIYHTIGVYAQDDFRVLPRVTLNLGLRYEPDTAARFANGQQIYNILNVTTATPPFGTPVSTVTTNPSLHNFSPRFGLAWDVRGNGKTAVRLGAGMYYTVGLWGGLLYNSVVENPPRSNGITINNTSPVPSVPLQVPVDPMANAPGAVSPLAPRIVHYHAQQPTNAQWNLTIDQQLPWGMALSVGYVGSRGWHLWSIREANPVIPAGVANGIPYYCNPTDGTPGPPTFAHPCSVGLTARPNPLLGVVNDEEPSGQSWFNSAQVVLTKRLGNGLQFQSSYTYERMIDNGIGQSSGDATFNGQIPQRQDLDKAVSNYNVPNNWRFNAIYHIPNLKSENFAAKLEHGWWAATIISVQAGQPFDLTAGVVRSLAPAAVGYSDRPSLDPSFNYSKLITGNPNQWFNPTMFDLQPAGTYGNAPRDLITGPNLRNVDFSLDKDTHLPWLGEAGILQFRAEVFNIMNHPNFGIPNLSLFSLSSAGAVPCGGQAGTTVTCPGAAPATITVNPNAGKILTTVTHSREIQFSLKVIF